MKQELNSIKEAQESTMKELEGMRHAQEQAAKEHGKQIERMQKEKELA